MKSLRDIIKDNIKNNRLIEFIDRNFLDLALDGGLDFDKLDSDLNHPTPHINPKYVWHYKDKPFRRVIRTQPGSDLIAAPSFKYYAHPFEKRHKRFFRYFVTPFLIILGYYSAYYLGKCNTNSTFDNKNNQYKNQIDNRVEFSRNPYVKDYKDLIQILQENREKKLIKK